MLGSGTVQGRGLERIPDAPIAARKSGVSIRLAGSVVHDLDCDCTTPVKGIQSFFRPAGNRYRSPSSQRATWASLGIRQSPRGDRLTEPTFGPSGRHDRLNWLAKNRVRNTRSQLPHLVRRVRAGRTSRAPRGTGSSPAAPRSAGSGTGRSRAARRGRSSPRSTARSCPSAPVGSSSGEISVATMSSSVSPGVAVELVLGRPAHQELHQRLRDADVRVVHAHVVGVVRTPAEGQLRQVAGADHEAGVHQQARPHPGLDVLERPGRAAAPAGTVRSFAVSASTSSPSRGMPNGAWPRACISSRHSGRMSDLAEPTRRAAASGRGRSPASGRWCRSRASSAPGSGRAARRGRRASCTRRAGPASSRGRRRRRWPTAGVPMCSSRCGQPGDLGVEDLLAALAQRRRVATARTGARRRARASGRLGAAASGA